MTVSEKINFIGGLIMKLSAPKQIIFLISVCLLIVGLVGFLVGGIPILSQFAYWFTFAGGALLTVGCFFKGI